jgi:hypothetical protein
MKKIIASVALTLTLAVLSNAQTAGTTKTICKGDPVPEGYTTVGETQSSECANGAWVVKQRASSKPRLEQSAGGSPRMIEENSTGIGRSRGSASTNDALEFAMRAFELLSQGDLSVEEMIDWDNLNIEGRDFGAMMKQIAASTQRDLSTFRKEFITNFGSYYKGSGDGPLRKWQIDSRNGERTIVAASSVKGEVILFTVSILGGRQVISAMNSRK